ncbi:MAG TPA: YdcH family protein [Rhodocyclaceae bacterium]|nr:YdcH family protein [Rhodocyclaceae bacterium]
MHTDEDPQTLQARLVALQIEHRDLDAVISHLAEAPPTDELLLRRMKKRKLQLKDQIALTERLLVPDDLA